MGTILKVTPETLLTSASNLESEGNQMKALTDQMLALIREISEDVWGGEAASTYKIKFEGLQDSILKLYRMVQEHVQDLGEISRTYSAAEMENQDISGTLLTDIIV